MRKFTVFTVLLTIVVMVVLGQILVDRYLPNLKVDVASSLPLMLPSDLGSNTFGATNVLGADIGIVELDDTDGDVIDAIDMANLPTGNSDADAEIIPAPAQNLLIPNSPSGLDDFEDPNFSASSPVSAPESVYLRDEQIKSAGFVGAYLEPEPHSGLLFKTITIDDLKDTEIEKTSIRTADQLLTKVYVFKAGIGSDINEIYQLIKMKASQGFDIILNETNEFGSNSFYMNDSRRSGTVFLTVRIGATVYAFSYPKEYHSQVKNLIQLLVWELG